MIGIYSGTDTKVQVMHSDLIVSNGMLSLTSKVIGRNGISITTYRVNIANLDPAVVNTEIEPPSMGNIYLSCKAMAELCFSATDGIPRRTLVIYADPNQERLEKLSRAFKHLIKVAHSQQRPDPF